MKTVGIIGCGNIARVHGWVLKRMPDVEVVAVCDTDLNRAKQVSDLYTEGCAAVFDDWHEMYKLKPDVIHICTPHYLHVPMAIEALELGMAVFMEKPCGISGEEFQKLKKIDNEHPGKLGFCFQNRYNETTKAMDEMIKQGVIGELKGARAFVTWCRDEKYYEGSDWKGKWSTEGGGVLINQSIHTLDLLLHYMGKPLEIGSTMANHHLKECIQVEDTVEAWLSFTGGKRACFYATNGYVTDAPVFLELQGEKGRITMNGSEITIWTPEKGTERRIFEQENGIGKGYWGCGHEACIRDFYDKLNGIREFEVNLKGVETTFETVMKIYKVANLREE